MSKKRNTECDWLLESHGSGAGFVFAGAVCHVESMTGWFGFIAGVHKPYKQFVSDCDLESWPQIPPFLMCSSHLECVDERFCMVFSDNQCSARQLCHCMPKRQAKPISKAWVGLSACMV